MTARLRGVAAPGAAAPLGAALLGLVLVAYTALVIAVPSARLAIDSLPLRLLLEGVIVGAMVGAALLLALLGRSGPGRGTDAFAAALVVQVVVGLVFAVLPVLLDAPLSLERSFYPWLVGRYITGVLLLLAAVHVRPASISVTVGVSLVVVALVEGVIVWASPPVPVVAADRTTITTDPLAYVLEAGPLIMFTAGAVVALRSARSSGQPLERWLGLALLTGVATQVHESMFPAGLGSVITSADVLRLLAGLLLAAGVVAQVVRLQVQRDRAVELLTDDLARNDARLAEVRDAREREAAFMSVVTHELTSPLAAINAHGHILEHLADDHQAPHVRAVLAEAGRLGALVERIDELRSIEQADFAVDLRPVSVRPLLEEVVAFVDGLPGNHRAVVVADEARLSADPIRLGQVLRNLAANSVRYAPDGTVITVSGERTGSGRYRLGIADEGPGIGADDLAELFEPYVRGTASADGESEGTGLGLYLARRIIDAHGGTIGFERPEDPGTRVVVELDLA